MSGGLSTVLPYKKSEQQQLLKIKTNVAGYFFDGFMKVEHNSILRITNHPIQTGANISDHAYEEPVELNMTILMSDAMKSISEDSETQFAGIAYTRSVGAYRILRQLQQQKKVFSVGTRLNTYDNMMIASLVANDDSDTLYGLNVNLGLKQIFVVNEKTVKVSSRQQTTDSSSDAIENAEELNESSLHALADMFKSYLGLD